MAVWGCLNKTDEMLLVYCLDRTDRHYYLCAWGSNSV